MLLKVARTLFFSGNACEAIAENWSARLDKSESIQKRKRLENAYKKCTRLLWNAFNVTYAILSLYVHEFRPPGGVKNHRALYKLLHLYRLKYYYRDYISESVAAQFDKKTTINIRQLWLLSPELAWATYCQSAYHDVLCARQWCGQLITICSAFLHINIFRGIWHNRICPPCIPEAWMSNSHT